MPFPRCRRGAQGDRAPLRAHGSQPCTLEEVGKAFGVTRERIRQIENNTLKKLESLPEAQGLKTACSERAASGGAVATKQSSQVQRGVLMK